jgi:hypothetical protein
LFGRSFQACCSLLRRKSSWCWFLNIHGVFPG